MNRFFEKFRSSALELKKISTVTGSAMLIALGVAIGSFTVRLTPTLKVGFSFLTNVVTGMLYGPVVGALAAGVGDIIKYFLNSSSGGAFFPGFTLNAMLAGMIYGLVLYKKPVTLIRAFIAKFIVMVVVNLFFGTLWNSMLYGDGFFAILPLRIYKNLLQLPIDVALIYLLAKVVEKVKVRAAI